MMGPVAGSRYKSYLVTRRTLVRVNRSLSSANIASIKPQTGEHEEKLIAGPDTT